MRYLTLVKANIKRQKGSFIGILLLIFIITVSLCAVLTIWNNAHAYEAEQFERLGYGDVASWVPDICDVDALIEQLLEDRTVEKVERQQVIMASYQVNGKSMENNGEITAYGQEYDYYIYNESLTGIEDAPEMLQEGEIYVPPFFRVLADARIGDEVTILLAGEQDAVTFTIKGFFEDPISGSSVMGIKTMLVNEADMERLAERCREAGEDATAWPVSILHIYKKAESILTVADFQSQLNEKTDLGSYAAMTYSKSAMMGFMLILQNLFSGFLLVFVIVLLVVAVIVIGHSICSSIEQDYVDMGILKAIGFTKGDLRFSQMLQYLAAVVAGIAFGIPVSALAVAVINKIIVVATGVMISGELPAGLCMLVLGAVFLLLAGFICFQTAKIGKITPIRAIRQGADDVYFKSRFTAPVRKNGLGFWLAVRQLVSGKKQYISAGIVTVLLVFFLSLSGRIAAWMGEDGKGIRDSFSMAPYDLGVQCQNDRMQQEIDGLVASKSEIVYVFEAKIDRAALNGIGYVMNVISEPEYYNMVEGRTCRYDNELVVTESVAEELGIGIGETVEVTYLDKSADFIVSGIYQCANDMGANFGISREAFYRLGGNEDEGRFYTYYRFKDFSQEQAIADTLRDTYGESVWLDENTWSGTDSMVLAMQALEILMYVITVIFILVVVSMNGSKILYKEQRDLGIYKSLGFASGQLRTAFALRFAIVAAVGSVAGTAFSAWLTDSIVSVFLKFCGISRFTSELTVVQMILPGLAVTMIFFVFAYLAAGKIKRVEPGILIVE